jgi:hypothetical protein
MQVKAFPLTKNIIMISKIIKKTGIGKLAVF